jgi:hypothetical protein
LDVSKVGAAAWIADAGRKSLRHRMPRATPPTNIEVVRLFSEQDRYVWPTHIARRTFFKGLRGGWVRTVITTPLFPFPFPAGGLGDRIIKNNVN